MSRPLLPRVDPDSNSPFGLYHPNPTFGDSTNQPDSVEPKLRLSCDACAAAKLRCSKERPRCQRCTAQDLSCVYGLSRKQKKVSSFQGFTQPANEHFAPNPNLYGSLIMNTSEAEASSGRPMGVERTEYLPTTIPGDEADVFMDAGGGSPWSFGFRDDSKGYDQTFPAQQNAHESPTQAEHIHSVPATAEHKSDIPVTSIPSIGQRTSRHGSSTRSGSPMSFSTAAPSHRLSDVEVEASNCLLQACSTMRSLEWPIISTRAGDDPRAFSQSSATVGLSGLLPTVAHSRTPPFEELLRANKAAIQQVAKILQCACSRNTHMLMLCTSILGRVLKWYQHMWRLWNSAQTTLETSMESQPSSPQWPSVSFSANPSIVSMSPADIMREALSTFDLDKEDQEAFLRQVVLNGLKRLGQATEMLHIAGPTKDETIPEQERYLNMGMQRWLRTELKITLSEVRTASSGDT